MDKQGQDVQEICGHAFFKTRRKRKGPRKSTATVMPSDVRNDLRLSAKGSYYGQSSLIQDTVPLSIDRGTVFRTNIHRRLTSQTIHIPILMTITPTHTVL